MDDRVTTAIYLFVLLIGGFAAYACQFVPGVRFLWRLLAWVSVYVFGLLGAVILFAREDLNAETVVAAVGLSTFAGAVTASGGWTGFLRIARGSAERDDG
jgi:hypothetical protein